jgi:hypothetical protein
MEIYGILIFGFVLGGGCDYFASSLSFCTLRSMFFLASSRIWSMVFISLVF